MRLVAGALCIGLIAVLLGGVPALGQSPSPTDLAEEALTDSAVRDELRNLTPEAEEALSGDAADVRERLETLAREVEITTTEDAGAEVRRILQQPRFATARNTTVGGFLAQLQQELLTRLYRLIGQIIDGVPGGPALFFGALILAALAVIGFFAARLATGRIRTTEAAALARIRRERGLSPSELRRRARDAHDAGDHTEAIRLLFIAGLTALDERGRIDFEPGTTTDEISESMTSTTFDKLADRFNEVVYGSRTAAAADYEMSQVDWNRVLEES